MKPIYEEAANIINDRRAFKFGAFKLKSHDIDPTLPLSPFYIDIRDENNPKGGPLKRSDYAPIAGCFVDVIINRKDNLVFDAIAGIPNAGDPIVDAMEEIFNATDLNQGDFRIIRLAKEVSDDQRRIIPMEGFEYREGERVLLIDDLVTKAHTKLEAIRAIESEGAIVVGLVVLVDRQQGGREAIEAEGYKIYCAFTATELFEYYRQTGRIDDSKFWECMQYLQNNK